MLFEYDPAKSAANRAKHGVDFEEAQALWDDANLIELDAHFEVEDRLLAVGRIGTRYWTAVHVYRGNVIRLISVRRARQREIASYDSRRI